MSRTRKPRASKAKQQRPNPPYHAFWSGSLSFGLVNVPVHLFPASRHSGVRLRLMSPEGSLLERRFHCPRDDRELRHDDIVRGYELDDGSYILIDDRELEAIEPQKTHEIDLREFVALSEISPALLERGYYLTPDKHATKAYRLLAEAMERAGRAGIATFVMRDREYLVAIFAQNGILCAETLRFQDEIRDPATIGLPAVVPAIKQRVTAFERSINALQARSLSPSELVDQDTQKLKAIIEKKRRAGKDLVRVPVEGDGVDSDGESDVDLLETIRRSLRHGGTRSVARQKPNKAPQKAAAARSKRAAASSKDRRLRPKTARN